MLDNDSGTLSDYIDNAAGVGGNARNEADSSLAAPLDQMYYRAYDAPGGPAPVPVNLDPDRVTGAFALWNPGTETASLKRGVYASSITNSTLVDYTAEGYFNLGETAVPASGRRLFTQRRNSSTSTQISVNIGRNHADTANVLELLVYNGKTGELVKGITEIVAGEWHHFALVVDRQDTGRNDVTVYLDGHVEISKSNVAPGAVNNSYPPVIGNFRADSGNAAAFVGYLDEIRVALEVLTPNQFLMRSTTVISPSAWTSPFETEAGEPVSRGAPLSTGAGAIDNLEDSVGGTATNPTAGAHYVEYGQGGVPPIPSAVDARGLAGQFAVRNSVDNAISTGIASRRLNHDFTLEMFVNRLDAQPPAGAVPGSLLLVQPGTDGPRVRFGLAQNGAGATVLGLAVADQTALGSTPVSADQWHHVALVVTEVAGTPLGYTLTAYLDGRCEILITNLTSLPETSDEPVMLLGEGTGVNGFGGLVDHVRLLNQDVSPSAFMLFPAESEWFTGFETERGAAVSHQQVVSAFPTMIDNDLPGPDGTVYNAEDLIDYVAYGQPGVPTVPGNLDPTYATGNYALRISPFEPADQQTVGLSLSTPIPSSSLASFTFECYFNLGEDQVRIDTINNPPQPLTRRFITVLRSQTSSQLSLGLGWDAAANNGEGANVIVLFRRNASGQGAFFTGTTQIQAGDWHHIAMIVDRDPDTQLASLRVYLDGQEEAGLQQSDVSLSGAGPMPVAVGGLLDRSSEHCFRGLLDAVRLLPRVLSLDQLLIAGIPPGPDFDGNGWVDADDLALFVSCNAGPAIPLHPDCRRMDLDRDGDVDQDDFGLFQRCYSGTGTPMDPACMEGL